MTRRVELVSMTPREVYYHAKMDGLYKARKLEGLGVKPNAVAHWYQGHPQYRGEEVLDLLLKGDEEVAIETFDRLHAGGNFMLINVTPSGVALFKHMRESKPQ